MTAGYEERNRKPLVWTHAHQRTTPLLQAEGEGTGEDSAGEQEIAELVRLRGMVQGVGFRPAVWRLARRHGLRGWVRNDAEGVIACVCGPPTAVAQFAADLRAEAPPLSRIDSLERQPSALPDEDDFCIVGSGTGMARTGVAPDAATCAACRAEILDPDARRFRYAFANCTHCGPRLSIIEDIPYDRATTTMRAFAPCPDCAAEYGDPADRRFHAQPIACPRCGPEVWLADNAARATGKTGAAALAAADAVARLRSGKRRERKPFALMARDLDVVRAYCRITDAETAALRGPAAPIVLLERAANSALAPGVAPGVATLGIMLPNTPLHHLLLQHVDRPIVLTSGNLSDEPQCIDNADAAARLGGIADYLLLHDRDVARRVDDSVVRRMAGRVRVLRRARGYAPAPLRLPQGFAKAPPLLAMGAELKNCFALLRDGEAILSHHMGDLENALTLGDYTRALEDYLALFAHTPEAIATDPHPEYLPSKLGTDLAHRRGVPIIEVQHHHAHIASCMAENGVARDARAVMGVALDGLGFGADGTIWGGEIILADYRELRRLVRLKPVAMPGGTQAIREPWRNAYAQIMAAMSWEQFAGDYGATSIARFLAGKPRVLLDGMMERGVNSPLSSSCGRLFDAVAAVLGICRERAHYEGQAAAELEALVDAGELAADHGRAYRFALQGSGSGALMEIDPAPMWQGLLRDTMEGVAPGVIAARFHTGLSVAITGAVAAVRARDPALDEVRTVALSGGVFQNKVLLEQALARLAEQGLAVLTHSEVPSNDGGLALGQAVVAAARLMAARE